jgi:hypothetical protein
MTKEERELLVEVSKCTYLQMKWLRNFAFQQALSSTGNMSLANAMASCFDNQIETLGKATVEVIGVAAFQELDDNE